MKRYIFFFAIVTSLVNKQIQAQTSPDKLLKIPHDTVSSYKTNNTTGGKLLLEMDFGSPVIKNKVAVKQLEGKWVYKIELVYTAYRLAETFEQPKLNKERLIELRNLYPDAFSGALIDWKFVAQTAGKDEQSAKKMFHGFVIHYAERAETTTTVELEYMKRLLCNDSLGVATTKITEKTKVKRGRTKTGKYLPRLKYKRKKGMLYDKKSIWGRKPEYKKFTDTIREFDTGLVYTPSIYSSSYLAYNLIDSSIFKIFDRNKQWKNILVVMDVTGSMSPYTSQVLAWHKLNYNTKNTVGYTFFNDGDNTPDNKKIIGKTGGIYFSDAETLQGVIDTAMYAMTRGGGGDAPENNIEAMLAALERFPDCEEVVMIADNWANIKDIQLAGKIKKPVHIILCGVYSNLINTQYLDLARQTKGTLHTVESDITTLMRLNEGQTITIDGVAYTVRKGKFVPVKKI